MKTAYKTLLASTFFVSSFVVAPFAQADNGQVIFSGTIINDSCVAQNTLVNFGNINLSTLASHDQTTPSQNFQVNLTGCPKNQNISVSLEGTPDAHTDTGKSTGLAMDSADGVATGVGIEVYEAVNGVAGQQMTFDGGTKTTAVQANDNGSLAFDFTTDVKSDSNLDVTPGKIQAAATIDINYE